MMMIDSKMSTKSVCVFFFHRFVIKFLGIFKNLKNAPKFTHDSLSSFSFSISFQWHFRIFFAFILWKTSKLNFNHIKWDERKKKSVHICNQFCPIGWNVDFPFCNWLTEFALKIYVKIERSSFITIWKIVINSLNEPDLHAFT